MAPMPKFLYGTYRKYKADTTDFVRWLVKTAKKSGHDVLLQTERQDAASCTNEKRKGKKSKNLAQASHKISLKQLTALAHALADSGTKLPPLILKNAQRAIALRKRCAKWFASGKDDGTSEPDTHSHFISVLEQICDMLGGKSRGQGNTTISGRANVEPVAASKKTTVLESNTFSHPTLEETLEEDTTPPASPDKQFEIEEEDSDSESIDSVLFLTLFCLFEDLHNMRTFVAQSVQEYVDGRIDLMNVAVVADTTVNLTRQLIDDTLAALPHLEEQQRLQEYVFTTACSFRGEDPEAKPDPTMPYNSNMADVADWCYFPALVLLTSFEDVLQPNQLPVMKKGHFGTYNASAGRDRMSKSARLNEDKIILLELLPEFALIHMFEIKMPVQDEITRALVDFTKTRRIPLYLCFAIQILLDVHHGLRYTSNKAYNDLRMSGLRISKTIEEYWTFSRTFTRTPKFWPKEGDEHIRDLQMSIEGWITEDVFIKGKHQVLPKYILAAQAGGMEKHFLLRSHGILCGLTMFHFTLRMQYISLELLNQWYDIPQMAYLFNIIQQIGMKNISWQDMDAFIEMHGEEHIFIGDRPNDADESIKKLQIVSDVRSPSDFASDRRNRTGAPSPNAKVRLMAPSAAVANIFQARYLSNGVSNISLDNIDKLLTEIDIGSSGAGDSQLLTASTQFLRMRWNKSHRLGALQLLAAIKQGMYHEEPRLQFNYFCMHKRGIELLRLIQAKEDHKFKQYFTAGYMPDDTLIGNLVVLILTVAQGSAAASRQLGIQQTGGTCMASRVVLSCEEVMENFS